jgi:hypothetical protein
MKRLALVLAVLLLAGGVRTEETKSGGLSFRTEEIEKDLGIGYAVLLADLNDDRKPDIVVVDKTRVVWYENPTWKRRVVFEGPPRPDNVCIAAADIEGDGKLDLAVGSGWGNLSSAFGGPVTWYRRGKTLDEPWTGYPIGEENSVHRIRFADIDGDGKPELIVAPLLGKGSTKEKNYMDVPIRTLAFRIPGPDARPLDAGSARRNTARHAQLLADRGRPQGHGPADGQLRGVSLLHPDAAGKWTPRSSARATRTIRRATAALADQDGDAEGR